MSDRERLDAWLLAASGHAKIILGTRFLRRLFLHQIFGLIVIDRNTTPLTNNHEGFAITLGILAINARKA